jgi:hypothetical protein
MLGRQARIIHVKTSKGARVQLYMGMEGKYMGKIIYGKDSTSDTWEGKDNTWDDTWKDFKMF